MYQYHPAADAFPMMNAERYHELLEDIREHGQRDPITLCEGKILDGRNRYRACIELNISPQFREFDGNPWDFAWSCNGQRRDLAQEQRAVIFVFVAERSQAWEQKRQQIAASANRKRSEAAKEQPRDANGFVVKQVTGHSVPRPDSHPGKDAKSVAAGVNRGAIARAEKLVRKDRSLAEKVAQGKVKSADAHRELKRREVVSKLESVTAVEAKEIAGVFDVIVMDPPWPMEKIVRDERPNQVAFDYPTMSEAELAAMPIPAADDCHLWVWTTHRFLPMAFRLVQAWGFKYVCTFVWHKPGGFQPIGLPQYNCEFALYARKGTPMFIDTKELPTCFEAPRGAHSEKPEEFYATVRRVTAGRRLDMFNRRRIEGFTGWGKEAAE